MFTHQHCEDHRSCEEQYLVLVNLVAPNDLNRGDTCLQAVFTMVPIIHVIVCKLVVLANNSSQYGFQNRLYLDFSLRFTGQISTLGHIVRN